MVEIQIESCDEEDLTASNSTSPIKVYIFRDFLPEQKCGVLFSINVEIISNSL